MCSKTKLSLFTLCITTFYVLLVQSQSISDTSATGSTHRRVHETTWTTHRRTSTTTHHQPSSSFTSNQRSSVSPEDGGGSGLEKENEIDSSNGGGGHGRTSLSTEDGELNKGLFPNVFNLATGSVITVNATCGETGPEFYCRLVEHSTSTTSGSSYRHTTTTTGTDNATQCNICDGFSPDTSKRHPIGNAIDGSESWWQSPTLQNGKRYEWVTININLRQMYEVAYVVLKSAISPLPANWILERSIDGVHFSPWQYFATSDTECWERYRLRPTIGKVRYRTDDQVICTSYYNKQDALGNNEVHVSLINGRPGAQSGGSSGDISDTLREFTKAQYIRIRMQKIRSLHGSLFYDGKDLDKADKTVTRRLFYSIKDITIGGNCVCNGHASDCAIPEPLVLQSPNYGTSSSRVMVTSTGGSSSSLPKCVCKHNTCGKACDRCCPLFNQQPWKAGSKQEASPCEECQCYGHADECYYDATIAQQHASINKAGVYEGGGVCVRCRQHTTGINCEQCEDGYYRPDGVPLESDKPCHRCQCQGPGMSRYCVKDDSHLIEGRRAGDCLCREGFEGVRCDRCAKGYRNYPRCEQCTCVHAGITNTEVCDGHCVCKANVQGTRCNKCKDNYYNLAADNPEGCSQCYCFGATDQCKPSDWGIETIRSPEKWMVTDVPGSFRLPPTEESGRFVVANDEVPSRTQHLYYWEAPKEYLGQNLYSYGNHLKYIINYVVVRGDTSGVYTDHPDAILEGGPEQQRIGFKWHKPPEDDGEDDLNSTIIMPLREQDWFRVDDEGNKIPDSQPTREDFTLILYDLKRLLVRAKYHTDQVEGGLYQVQMEKASNSSQSIKKAVGTEQCDCPPGYAGLSCEYCQPGYRRVNNILVNGICEKCNCNNHALSCDPYTGACSECLHNTTGPTCGECKPGFWGDATRGKEDDCKPCACPLLIPTNNFSPTCRAEPTAKYGYICLECPEGYTGERCEICANGWYGNPLIPGGFCAPCDCGPNANVTMEGYCDHITGECKYCLGNTAGWKCDECLPDHWGNPEIGDCKPCNCNPKGSTTTQCNMQTGQCECKPNYTGPRCDRCAPGYGNLELDCPPCKCNLTGSVDDICDPESGQCHCKPGVFGQHCDQCLEGHFGFSDKGCEWCNCNKLGSEGPDCDEKTGQCLCKPYVTERDCSHCEPGYWNMASGKGCEPCNCNFTGSYSNVCEENTGQCQCKPGVGGLHCDQCLPGYYGFSSAGCQKCEPCDAPGHICDQKTGKCVCPPNTAGPTCNDCAPGTWGHDILTGCSPCACDLQGSVNNECNHKTGQCVCLDGFEGEHCDKCKFGYYRFPNCRRCDCHEPGTEPGSCRGDGLCQCNESGQCPCRANVAGRRCDMCKEGTFALTIDNPLGCFSCFCFGKTGYCEQSSMVWTEKSYPQREVTFVIGSTEVRNVLNFKVIPHEISIVGVTNYAELQRPFYWSLPPEIINDQVTSYNAYLRFRIYSRGGSKLNEHILRRYPLVVLQGNHRLILYHFGPEQPSTTGLHNIRLHESQWTLADNPEYPVTRDVLMVALQKVQHILIRASDLSEANYVRLSDLSLEVAVSGGFSSRQAIGIEQCRCPPQYTAASCQDPNIGYCRKRKPNFLDSKDILDLVGWAEPCQCNNYSRVCDRETCECLNCEGFTTGPQCNLCIRGYYGDPTRGIPCRKCACPTLVNSFSETCELVPGSSSEYVCTACAEGYTGKHCEQCADGYWGNPMAPNGKCTPCKCSPIGSLSNVCDKQTGQCPCKEGITGHDCSNCPPRHVVVDTGCLNCDDNCTGLLLDDVDFLHLMVKEMNLTDVSNLPWTRLMYLTKNLNRTIHNMNMFKSYVRHGKEMVNNFTINFDLETLADLLNLKARELARKAPDEARQAQDTLNRAQNVKDMINDLWQLILNIVNQLKRHGVDSADPLGTASDRMFEEAQRILQELKNRDFDPDINAAQRELKYAQFLLDKVRQMLTDREHTGPIRNRLDKLLRLLSEIYEMINRKIFPETREALQRLSPLRPQLRFIMDAVDNATRNADITNSTLAEARELLKLIGQELYDTKLKFASLPDLVAQMMNLTDIIEKRRSILARLNPEYEEKYVRPCVEHAEELMRRVDELGRLFNQTRDVAEFPLQAAKVYETIVKAIEEAELAAKNAREAAEKAYKQVYPDNDQSLLDQAIAARRRSEELLREAEELTQRLYKLQEDLAEKRRLLMEIEAMIEKARHDLEYIKQALDALPRDLSKDLSQVITRLRSLLTSLERTHVRVDDLAGRINELVPRVEQLRAGTTAGLDDVKKDIDGSLQMLQRVKEELVRVESRASQLDRTHKDFDENLKELKLKIMLARQNAASIRVSLGADREQTCIRTYEPDIEPSFTNNILMYYSVKHDHQQDSLLLYLGSRGGNGLPASGDFMALEMKSRRIRFVWNTGTGERMIQHPLVIETNDQQLNKDSRWYKIEVKRFGSYGNLTVQRVPDAHTVDPFEVSDTSSHHDQYGSKRMDLDRNSYFYVGGLPSELMHPPRQLQARSFAGCLYELQLDGKRVGLWNFTSNIGCDGCKEGAIEPIDPTMYRFNSEFSYSRSTQIPHYNRATYLVSFSFKTFDEDALLFFTSNRQTHDHVAIYLKDGKVHYECHFGGTNPARPTAGTTLLLVSPDKVNTGTWIQLRAEREGELSVLEINGKQTEKKLPTIVGGRGAVLDLAHADIYFGGVEANFTSNTSLPPHVVFKSFVGCMNSPQIDTVPINLEKIQSFGVEPGCIDKPIRVASFTGDGFLELDGRPLIEDKVEFSFTFKTTKKSGILLLSTFEQKNRAKEEHYYFFYISNSMLEVRLNGGGGTESFYPIENVNVSDGNYHTVTCIKENRRFRIFIDDEYESPQIRLAKARVIEAPVKGGFFIGGTPIGYNSVNKGYASNFHGVIRDIVFDSKLVSFNSPTKFRGVGIGREGATLDWLSQMRGTDVLGGTTSKTHIKATTNQQSSSGSKIPYDGGLDSIDRMMSIPAENYDETACASMHAAMLTTTEVDAIKFGGHQRANATYVQVDTHENEFYSDFSLSFSFRSYYPNGVLFTLARNSGSRYRDTATPYHRKPVFVVALLNGQVVLRMKMSDRHYVELKSAPHHKLNDGQWHHVYAGRKELSLYLNTDFTDRVENNKPKRRLALKKDIHAFIGGLPEELDLFNGIVPTSNNGYNYLENELHTSNGQAATLAPSSFLPTYEGFKGCIRKFTLNDRKIDFRALRLEDGVGTCFTEIEKGAYFSGEDSFAVYEDTFNIGLKADISFEFRTTKQTGVLFAMSNGSDTETPSFAIELTKQGEIVASVDLGGGAFRARKKLSTPYELCDGKWHTVRVQYTQLAITLKVDSAEATDGLNETKDIDTIRPYTAAPLYVGGLPRLAPSGALLSREPFVGCMRNIEVNDVRKDWLSIQLFNIEPNACPAPAKRNWRV